MNHKKALFLDRDGIINIDRGYVYRFSDIEWVDGIIDLIKFFNSRDFLVIVLTNQSGIARDYYTEQDVKLLHQQMEEYLKSEGATITDWFYCSKLDSIDRKPNPGMLLKARDKYQIDLKSSFMIGDKISDVFSLGDSSERPLTYLVQGQYELNLDKKLIEEGVRVFSDVRAVYSDLKTKVP